MSRMIWLRGCGFCRNQRYTEDIPGGQWLIACLPMQGPQFRSLVQEDSTCLRATKPRAAPTEPICQSLGAVTIEPKCPRACALQ